MSSNFRNHVRILDPHRLLDAATRQASSEADAATHRQTFQARFNDLVALCGQYLFPPGEASPPPRIAEIWADTQPDSPDFYFVIWTLDPERPADWEKRHRLLAGCLHYHESDGTWGIHT